ncbi:MAG: BON domain-containing protein [Caulobacteraceae bacterium]
MTRDDALRRNVIAELEWEPSITAAHIGVTAEDGVVTLSGHVHSYPQKHAAELAALRVKGVQAVAEEIEVQLPVETQRGDDALAAAAIHRLSWDVAVPAGAIQVRVEKGWVTLTGQVDRHHQKEAAGEDVRGLMGVTGLSNLVAVKSMVDTSNITDDITHALHRSWVFDPNAVRVRADGGKVRLTGTVRTPHERRVAAATAWTEPGVTEVENDIVVA